MLKFRLLSLALLLVFTGIICQAHAQSSALPFAFYTTYRYTAYTVFEADSTEPPTEVAGVGGTLTLQADGHYVKRLEITNRSGVSHFNQDGQYTLAGDSIRFAYTDVKGQAQTYEGAFRFEPQAGALEMTIFGFPPGSKGVYRLAAGGVVPVALPSAQPAHKPARKTRK